MRLNPEQILHSLAARGQGNRTLHLFCGYSQTDNVIGV